MAYPNILSNLMEDTIKSKVGHYSVAIRIFRVNIMTRVVYLSFHYYHYLCILSDSLSHIGKTVRDHITVSIVWS